MTSGKLFWLLIDSFSTYMLLSVLYHNVLDILVWNIRMCPYFLTFCRPNEYRIIKKSWWNWVSLITHSILFDSYKRLHVFNHPWITSSPYLENVFGSQKKCFHVGIKNMLQWKNWLRKHVNILETYFCCKNKGEQKLVLHLKMTCAAHATCLDRWKQGPRW